MSDASRIIAAILLIAVLTVEFGGLALLAMLTRRLPGYLDNPLRQNLFQAGPRPRWSVGGVRSSGAPVGGPD